MEPGKEAVRSYIFKAFRFGDDPIKLHVHLTDVFVFLITELVAGRNQCYGDGESESKGTAVT